MKDSLHQLIVPESTQNQWQQIANLLSDLIDVPAALIMRLKEPIIEVFVSSEGASNPYQSGAAEEVWGSGLYCETVMKTKDKLLIPNALEDEHWTNNPDVKLNMISYLGFPIMLPDGKPFGTLCVLDNKANAYSHKAELLMESFRNIIQSDLEILYVNQILGDRNKRLADYLSELQTLRGVVQICSGCKGIQNNHGEWIPIEEILIKHPDAKFSHGLCPDCRDRLYPGL